MLKIKFMFQLNLKKLPRHFLMKNMYKNTCMSYDEMFLKHKSTC